MKKQENLTSAEQLIVLKADIKSEDYQMTYVQYEIYNPISMKKINLNVCQNISILINAPVNITSNLENLYDSLNKSGFNLFNSNDPFYNDICSPYTSQSGKDIPMADRQSEIFNNVNNNKMCQNNCKFIYYNSTSKKANCNCEVQVEEIEVDKNKINFKKEIVQTFFSTLTNSNFLVLKCYKLVFSMKGQTGNSGSYIMTILSFVFIFLIFLYSIFGSKKILAFIDQIIKQKMEYSQQKISNIKRPFRKLSSKIKNKKEIVNENNLLIEKNKSSNKKRASGKSKDILKNNNNEPPKQKRIKNKKFPSAYNNLSNDMLNKQSHIIINNNYNDKEKVSDKISPKKSLSFIRHKKLKKKIKRKKKIINNNVVKYKLPISIPLSSSDLIKPENNRNQYKKQITINKNEAQILNDHELNNLEYELAL